MHFRPTFSEYRQVAPAKSGLPDLSDSSDMSDSSDLSDPSGVVRDCQRRGSYRYYPPPLYMNHRTRLTLIYYYYIFQHQNYHFLLQSTFL